jgi:mono/diheme cytochrome c family protein
MNRVCIIVVLASVVLCTACRQDMQDQPKYKPLGENTFFPDGRNSRPIPANTIALDELNDTGAYHTGMSNGTFVDTIPAPINVKLLNRGHDRYDIFCSPCHGRLGDGNGMVAQRGLRAPANFHTDRLRSVPPGYIFQVITSGYGGMGDYADQVPVDDRWAIVAYIRALQLSRDASLSDVPADARAQLGVQP